MRSFPPGFFWCHSKSAPRERICERDANVSGLVLVPDVPVVHVALRVLLPSVAEVAGSAARRGRPVGALRVVLRDEVSLQLRALDPLAAVEVGIGLGLLEPLDRAKAFVVSAPHRDGRVVAEALELVRHLVPDLAEKRVVARIDRARAHHVVPEKNALLVAEVVEAVLLVLSAAPDADHVHVGPARALDELRIALWRLLVLVGGARNPVRALHEEAASVDAEDERKLVLAVPHGLLVQHLDLPEADLPDDLLASRLELGRVELLLAGAVRPPERGIVDLELLLDLRAVGELRRHRERAVREAVVELLRRIDVLDARTVRRDQLGRPAEADHLHRGTPVPSGVARGLADERLVLRPHDVRHREGAALRLAALVGLVLGASELALDRVLPLLQERLHVERVALEAVRRLADLLSVHENRAEAVAVFEAEYDLLLREEVL